VLIVCLFLSRGYSQTGGEQVFEQGGLDKRGLGEQMFDKKTASFLPDFFLAFQPSMDFF
jgi:hypothetical protein